jgi:hypothetical protein
MVVLGPTVSVAPTGEAPVAPAAPRNTARTAAPPPPPPPPRATSAPSARAAAAPWIAPASLVALAEGRRGPGEASPASAAADTSVASLLPLLRMLEAADRGAPASGGDAPAVAPSSRRAQEWDDDAVEMAAWLNSPGESGRGGGGRRG